MFHLHIQCSSYIIFRESGDESGINHIAVGSTNVSDLLHHHTQFNDTQGEIDYEFSEGEVREDELELEISQLVFCWKLSLIGERSIAK
jgi:hypothetical protein